MSEDLIQALRRAYAELKVEMAQAAERLTNAQQASEAVRARYEAFRNQLDDVCAAAGFPVSAVVDEPNQTGEPNVAAGIEAERTSRAEPFLALPCRPQSLRWYAGQALHRLGGEGLIPAVAEEMRRLGFKHNRPPARGNQLEQSLAALPSQVHWIVPGKAPGQLRLALK